MDRVSLAGLLLTAVGVVTGFYFWLRPRAPNNSSLNRAASPMAESELLTAGLRVSSSFGFLTFNNPPRLSEDQMLFIEAANANSRPIRVVFISMNIEDSTK